MRNPFRREKPKPFILTPELALDMAAMTVKVSKDIFKVELDFSPASLQSIDDILEDLRKEGNKQDEIILTLLGIGCYVGEVMVRNLGAIWETPQDNKDVLDQIVITFPGRDLQVNAIGKVLKRFANGSEDSVVFFYQWIQTESARQPE